MKVFLQVCTSRYIVYYIHSRVPVTLVRLEKIKEIRNFYFKSDIFIKIHHIG